MCSEYVGTMQLIWKTGTFNWTSVHQKILLAMKTKETPKEKEFDTVQFFRAVREKIAKETKGMTFAELKAYLNKRKLKTAQ